MPQIEIKPHANSIGGNQKIDITILIEINLCIPGARAEPPHHHRRAATLAPDKFSNLINIGRTERHHRAAPRQPG